MPMTIGQAQHVANLLQHLAGKQTIDRGRLDEAIDKLNEQVGKVLGAGMLSPRERTVAAATLEHVRGDVYGTSPIPATVGQSER